MKYLRLRFDLNDPIMANFTTNFVLLLGHCPMDQIPETVNKEVLRFLNSIA